MSLEPNSENPTTAAPDSTPLQLEPSATAETAVAEVVPTVTWREFLAVALFVVLADVTIYRGHGFAGLGVLFLLAPLLLWFGAFQRGGGKGACLIGVMLVLLAAKIAWCGSVPAAVSGFVLIVAFAMTLSGLCPYVLATVVFASQTISAGYEGLILYCRSSRKWNQKITWGGWLNFGLPLMAFVAFGLLFIVANPNLSTLFGETIEWISNTLRRWILDFFPTWTEVLFWFAATWIVVGLLRPARLRLLQEEQDSQEKTSRDSDSSAASKPVRALLYSPFRNTLATVIVLFAVYLAFEFRTLWFREFPAGFHYSGYAHEGAAWLTVALALATAVLSLIFRGAVLGDPRLGGLRRLAWIWSGENLLLVAAVYHRILIYVGFNGMTRMRTVAVFGISCVVVGFGLVVWKIVHGRDFAWLLRRHLWALALAVYLFSLTPVDSLVHAYNVRRILGGDPAPSVQISVHPINTEGILVLFPLLDCKDTIIREGVRAMLAQRLDDAEALAKQREEQGWTTHQVADRLALDRLRKEKARWAPYTDLQKRRDAIDKFDKYAYQWY